MTSVYVNLRTKVVLQELRFVFRPCIRKEKIFRMRVCEKKSKNAIKSRNTSKMGVSVDDLENSVAICCLCCRRKVRFPPKKTVLSRAVDVTFQCSEECSRSFLSSWRAVKHYKSTCTFPAKQIMFFHHLGNGSPYFSSPWHALSDLKPGSLRKRTPVKVESQSSMVPKLAG